MNRIARSGIAALALLACFQPLQADAPEQIVVLHLKNGAIEAGLAGEAAPQLSMPAVMASSRRPGPMIGMGASVEYFGEEAIERQATLQLRRAIEGDVIVDPAAFEKIVQHILTTKLGVQPDEVAVVMNEAANNAEESREDATRLFFETFNVAGFFMSPHFTSWTMAAGMAADSSFVETLITPDEYDEIGAEVIHRKSPI